MRKKKLSKSIPFHIIIPALVLVILAGSVIMLSRELPAPSQKIEKTLDNSQFQK